MKNLKNVVLLLGIFTSFILAQSISFTSPSNGNTYTSTGNSSKVGVYFGYGFSNTPSPIIVRGSYVKLIIDNTQTYSSQSSSIPNYYEMDPGTHTMKLELWELYLGSDYYERTATSEITIYTKFTIFAVNNFSGGVINLEGNQVNVNGTNNKAYKLPNESVSVGSIEQSDGTYWRLWNTSGTNNSNWQRDNSSINGATSSSLSYTVGSSDNGVTLTADMKKLCSLEFNNSYSSMYINGSTYSSTTTVAVVEQNSITAYGNTYTSSGIEYIFSHWSYSGGTSSSTVTPSAHGIYTANYSARAINPEITFGTTLNQPIVINWTDNQNSNVTQYRIHRRVYNNGWGADQVIATVSNGVQTYTDNDYILKPWRENTWLEYGITAYYSVNSTWSPGGANTQVYGLETLMQSNETAQIKTENEVPVDYSIKNYPNPFNPTTTINYQLPKDGMVTIKVYDIIGKEVATLVNEAKSAGYYKADFDASKLTSGVYICSIQASGFNKSIKLLLTK